MTALWWRLKTSGWGVQNTERSKKSQALGMTKEGANGSIESSCRTEAFFSSPWVGRWPLIARDDKGGVCLIGDWLPLKESGSFVLVFVPSFEEFGGDYAADLVVRFPTRGGSRENWPGFSKRLFTGEVPGGGTVKLLAVLSTNRRDFLTRPS